MEHSTALKARYVFRLVVALYSVLIVGAYATAQLPGHGGTHHLSRADAGSTDQRSVRVAAMTTSLSSAADGWHSWTVDAVEDAPAWCCYSWYGKDGASAQTCRLDGDSYGMSSPSKTATAEQFNIYAKLEQGRVTSVRAYAASCPVTSKSPVNALGNVDASVSVEWLYPALTGDKTLSSSALAAIAVHTGDRAQQILVESTDAQRPVSLRKDAIFWMGQVRARQSEDHLTRLLRSDDNDKVREHTVFSVSQSNLERKLSLITRVAREDRSTKVRSQAWFWLAQTNDPQAGQLIIDGMKRESSTKVLKQAVFALSQLSGDEAVDRLIDVVENPKFDRDVRQQGLFWLAQDGSSRAVDYLAQVLDR